MTKKKITYILLVCVLCLWGGIFYRIFLSKADQPFLKPSENRKKELLFTGVNHESDTLVARIAYRNPFGITEMPKPTAQSFSKLVPAVKKSNFTPSLDWGSIKYHGSISNVSSKRHVAIISISGREFMFYEGQLLAGVKMTKWANDSVKILYGGEARYIKLK